MTQILNPFGFPAFSCCDLVCPVTTKHVEIRCLPSQKFRQPKLFWGMDLRHANAKLDSEEIRDLAAYVTSPDPDLG